ncbi:hypothetical protein DM2_3279 [Halorubrum sp. DM2]|nr:hypothetical protein [Halorubrum sp. DM2]VTT87241.1 hypothetical protein DM2_3279 [Halorubrum sp. DM2]
MSATTPSIAIDHPTVVPANFDPDGSATDDATGDETASDDA